jgi:hypothetical protein
VVELTSAAGPEPLAVGTAGDAAHPAAGLLNDLLAALLGCCNNAMKTALGVSMKQRCV